MNKVKKYFIVTFGCQQNEADSERIAAYYEARGYKKARSKKTADDIIINTCMIREKAENRVYGLTFNLGKEKAARLAQNKPPLKIIVTGCMVGMAFREKTGKMLSLLRSRMPTVDEFLPIEEVGFDTAPVRTDTKHAWVPITNGCNNFCTFCVVPFTRGREISRPLDEIISEIRGLAKNGYTSVTLLGQNVNSYGADLLLGEKNVQVMRDLPDKQYFDSSRHSREGGNLSEGKKDSKENIPASVKIPDQARLARFDSSARQVRDDKITYVKHLGRLRIPTLFPFLLETIASIDGIESIDFMSSNPWDFSDDLIEVMKNTPKISRHIHLPVQSGDSEVLKKMNRWYSRDEYLALVDRLKKAMPEITISTDIIVGFCGETEEQFQNTVDLCQKVGFSKAYVAMYSDRPMTAAHKAYTDDVPHPTKKRRWKILEEMINRENLKNGTYR